MNFSAGDPVRSDPKTIAPSNTVREKAAETIDESQDSEEPV
jgi:hypothetical protein